VAAGLVAIGRLARPAAVLAGLALFGAFGSSAQAFYYDTRYQPDDFRSAVRFLDERWGPGDAVLLDAGYVYPPVLYYLRSPVGWRGRLEDYPAQPAPAGGMALLETGSIGGGAQLGGGDPRADFWATTE